MSTEFWQNQLSILLADANSIISYEGHDCFITVDKYDNDGDAFCTIGCKSKPEETWKMVVTHMRDPYGVKPMLRISHEGRRPFYVEADPSVLIDLID